MPDLNSKQFQFFLADTLVSCKMKAIGMDPIQTITTAARVLCTGRTDWEEAQEIKGGWLGSQLFSCIYGDIHSARKMHFIRDSL